MKIPPVIKSLIVVIIMSMGFYWAWKSYDDFLSQGQKPPESAVILNEIEKNGVPNFSVVDLNGRSVTLDQFLGKIVILNFWASWCDPCIAEFPSLLKLLENQKGKVVLMAVSADYERADIDNFLKVFKVNSPHLIIAWDKDLVLAKKFGTFKLPESYIIGTKGELIRKVAGVDDWATKEAFEYFEGLLKK